MKKIFWISAALTVLIILSGCATKWDVQLWQEHAETVQDHDEYQYNSVSDVAHEMASMKAIPKSSAGPWEQIAIMLSNGNITRNMLDALKQYKPYTGKSPTLNTDNVKEAGKTLRAGFPILGMVRVVDKTASEIGDENYKASGSIKVNKTEVHTTAFGEGNELASGYGNEESAPNSHSDDHSSDDNHSNSKEEDE